MLVGPIEWIKKWAFRLFLFCFVIAVAATLGSKWPEVVHGIFSNTIHSIVGIFTGHSKLHVPKPKIKP